MDSIIKEASETRDGCCGGGGGEDLRLKSSGKEAAVETTVLFKLS